MVIPCMGLGGVKYHSRAYIGSSVTPVFIVLMRKLQWRGSHTEVDETCVSYKMGFDLVRVNKSVLFSFCAAVVKLAITWVTLPIDMAVVSCLKLARTSRKLSPRDKMSLSDSPLMSRVSRCKSQWVVLL